MTEEKYHLIWGGGDPDSAVWKQIQDACNCSVRMAKVLVPDVMSLVQEGYSTDRAIAKLLADNPALTARRKA